MGRRGQTALRAFSLVELVCILTIISTLAAIAAPRLGGVLAHRQVDSAAHRVTADLALARHRARQTSQVQGVEFDATTHRVIFAGMPDPSRPTVDYTVNLNAAPYHATLTSVVLDAGKTVAFDHYGMPDLTTNGIIQLQVGRYVRNIELNADTGIAEVLE